MNRFIDLWLRAISLAVCGVIFKGVLGTALPSAEAWISLFVWLGACFGFFVVLEITKKREETVGDIGTCVRRALTGQPITEEEEAALWVYVERQAKREDRFISAVCVLSVILIVCAIAKFVLA